MRLTRLLTKDSFYKLFKKNKEPGDLSYEANASKAAAFWEKSECPYERALVMFEAKDDDKRKAIVLVQDLGAVAVYQKMIQAK